MKGDEHIMSLPVGMIRVPPDSLHFVSEFSLHTCHTSMAFIWSLFRALLILTTLTFNRFYYTYNMVIKTPPLSLLATQNPNSHSRYGILITHIVRFWAFCLGQGIFLSLPLCCDPSQPHLSIWFLPLKSNTQKFSLCHIIKVKDLYYMT